ncbi:MAG: NADPH-dependent FMN reductase [Alphaproteobacteria bacterium]|jgi:chromate reductase|nr:NADPH-dependent FMN reductase [Alphaproteobacteria bacterium]MDP6565904.1 NADPH-dependent FMN reductase [Alphaproteobacteria bacterium]MDP6812618.1 NADPH-dependent FMN reductase [Alphaproteobacteria bacterium]
MQVLGISGSLRQGSFNTAALRAAQGLAPAGMMIEIADISAIPLYDQDLRDAGFPTAAEALCRQIAAADGVLIATPEYNYSVSGVLKNAIDWASRFQPQPFDGKPIAILGAAAGRLGTARAQYHLRQIFVFLNGLVINKPEVMIGSAAQAFDDQGNLTDEMSRELIGQLLTALADWQARLKG